MSKTRHFRSYSLIFLFAIATICTSLFLAGGCSTSPVNGGQGNWIDRHLFELATNGTRAEVVTVTNTIRITNEIREVIKTPEIIFVTNALGATVTQTNTVNITNVQNIVTEQKVLAKETNQVPNVELVPKASIEKGIAGAGSLPIPYAGFGAAILMGGLHIYQNLRNKKQKMALVQGTEDVLGLLHTKEGSELRDQGIELLQKAQARYGVLPDIAAMVKKWTGSAPVDTTPPPARPLS